jgi:hypothetical protein
MIAYRRNIVISDGVGGYEGRLPLPEECCYIYSLPPFVGIVNGIYKGALSSFYRHRETGRCFALRETTDRGRILRISDERMGIRLARPVEGRLTEVLVTSFDPVTAHLAGGSVSDALRELTEGDNLRVTSHEFELPRPIYKAARQ